MRTKLRLAALWEYLRGSLWPVPAAFVVAAFALGTTLALIRPADDPVEGLVFAGSASGARDVLSIIAGAMITVTSLTFSLTVIALQMASSQFSPRVLREFLSDRGHQMVLGVFLATFAYCLAVVRVIQDEDGVDGELVPRLAVTVGILLALLSVAALVAFIHHLTQQLRVDRIMRDLVDATLRTIDRAHPDPVGEVVEDPEIPTPPDDAYRVRAKRSGYLQAVTVDGLVRAADRLDVVVQLRARVGGQIPQGTTLAWVWPRSAGASVEDPNACERAVHDHVHLGDERTMQQDVAFGIRQLSDIAARALSTGVNDPTTARDVVGWLSVIVGRLAGRRLDATVRPDAAGLVRAVIPAPWFADYLALACDQVRRYGCQDPDVVCAVLELLLHAAEVAVDDRQRAAIAAECARTVEVAGRALDDTDMSRVRGAAELVEEAIAARGLPQPASLQGA